MSKGTQKRFKGFSKAGMAFLRGLAKHNDRSWFAARKPIYESELLEPLGIMLADATDAMRSAKIDLMADPRHSRFRIYRDIRFSRDKSPYKTNLGAYLSSSKGHDEPGGLYIHIQPAKSFMAIAFYQLEKEPLQRWRTAMANDPKHFQSVLRALERNGVKLSDDGEALKRMPRGFEAHAQSPIAKYFRMGSFIVSERLTDTDVMSARLIDKMVVLAKRAKPLMEYGRAL